LPLGYKVAPTAAIAAILSPTGKVLENRMPRFFRRLAEGVFDIEDLKFRTNELADFVKDASKFYDFDLQRTIAVGYSNGTNIASSMLLLRPEILSAAIMQNHILLLKNHQLNLVLELHWHKLTFLVLLTTILINLV
jgi:phospholipase/carboxylesterase